MSLLGEFIFPQKCLLCGKLNTWLCVKCEKKLFRTQYQICPECGLKAFNERAHPGCLTKTSLAGLYSPFLYKQGIKKLLKAYKFELAKQLQKTITNLFILEFEKKRKLLTFFRKEKYILVPLPLHPIKEKWRGFNQSLLLGRDLAKELNLNYNPRFLKRTEFAPPQVGLSKGKRQANIKNQFQASNRAKGKNIILFDDVWTTGATLKEAGKELKLKGAKTVWGLTLCR